MRTVSGRRASRVLPLLALALVCGPGPARAVLLDVPLYRQCDGAWADDPLGTCSDTVCSAGCAITSSAMLYEYFGGTLDPGALNTCLTDNGGYASGCLLYWSNPCMPDGVSYEGTGGDIDASLASGYPVIAHVTSSQTSMHFVLIIGNEGGEYQINDPGWTHGSISEGGYTIQGLRFYSGTVCACASGDQEQRGCGLCGTETRTCDSGCTWSDWVCVDSGACNPEAQESCGTCGTRTCDVACAWGACDDPCAGDAGVADAAVPSDGGSRPDAASLEDGRVVADASPDGPGHRMTGGCDCHTGGPGPAPLPLAFVLLVLLGLARSRRRGSRQPEP